MEYLLWVRGVKGPTAQLVNDPPRKSANHQDYWNLHLIASIKLPPEHQDKNLFELEKLHPCPEHGEMP